MRLTQRPGKTASVRVVPISREQRKTREAAPTLIRLPLESRTGDVTFCPSRKVPFLLLRSSSVASSCLHHDPGVTPGDAVEIDPDGRLGVAPENVFPVGERDLAVSPDEPAVKG